ncbi:copper resistance protein NlpE [Luteimonas kalidii]|uniref:Copper resistance protein NlpE n=1 Tax=Luteimonas kalidii TaxID=3042025 RepID=A0ABT6JTN3_9GAMM|nr:copper resistance protein NlpE [Luteimonas kalidii]MDH5834055.1 copper resistance protein NlpE [Luteimonas kalidii]
MVHRHLTRLALAPLLWALAACTPDPDPSPEPAPEPVATAAHAEAGTPDGIDATAVVHHSPDDPAGFDRKAFAGRFAGTLPCADCPGIDTSVQIGDDGTFRLVEAYRDRDTRHETAGTWTVDADGTRLQFDPDTKQAADRWFEIVSKDELRALDTEGRPIAGNANTSLRRG